MLVGEADECLDRTWLGHGVWIGDEHVLADGGHDADVDVRGEGKRPRVLEHPHARRHCADAAGSVRDHEQVVDLRRERRQRAFELGRMTVRDDDGGDPHRPSTSR